MVDDATRPLSVRAGGFPREIPEDERRGIEEALRDEIELCRREVAEFPNDPDAWHELSDILGDIGDWHGVIDAMQHAIALDHDDCDWRAYRDLGGAYAKLGDVDAALAAYYRSTRIEPKQFMTWAAIARVHLDRKEFSLALPAVERAVAYDPEDSDKLLILGETYVAAGKPDGAIRVRETLQRVAPDRVAELERRMLEMSGPPVQPAH